MENLIEILKADPENAIKKLTASTKDPIKIQKLREEYNETNRHVRKSQIGWIQKDKHPAGRETVKAVRIPIAFQKKIVNTAAAFEVGEQITLKPSNDTELSKEIGRLWNNNRIDFKLQELVKLQKSELQCALLFSIEDLKPNNFVNRILGVNTSKEIKTKILKNSSGTMTPYFNEYGNMTAFVWEYLTRDVKANKDVRNVLILDKERAYTLNNALGKMALTEDAKAHGFDKIPIVYFSQEKEEWFDVKEMIDRLEVTVSKLGAANDYSGQPILKLFGKVNGAPDKDADGKAMHFNMVEGEDGKIERGDAEFLERSDASQSVELEIKLLNNYISSMTSTPDWSFESLKGLGDISGKALKMMFIDPLTKAKMNEGYNRTAIERILSVFISGTITTTQISYKSQARDLFYDIQFNSIIPDDVESTVESVIKAVNGNVMSIDTALSILDFVTDKEAEKALIMERLKPIETIIEPIDAQ